MSQTIDDRVVQLEFDNGQFERGVQESLGTLQKLKGSLNMDSAAKNLTALGNAASRFNLDGISNAVEMVGEKFSYMKYAGLVALSNLVTGAMQAGKRIVSALTGPIMTGGWNRAMNLEQANFMMKGLLKTDDAVAAVMKDVSESVDGTAYSLDAAAKVAAQFAASGVKAGENMLPSLKAVAGTAAMTNSSFEDIGQIFTTVAGQGKLMTYQMRQLEFRGLNVAATLGEQMGKTEAEIRDMVTKGKISFDMFSDAMNAAFGEHAQEANNTFSGALANVRSALGRIGAEFATPFIHNIIPVLNSFRLAINATKATLGPFFEFASSSMETLSKRISKSIDGYTSRIKNYAGFYKAMFKDITDIVRNLSRFVGKVMDPIREAFNETFTGNPLAAFRKIIIEITKFTRNLSLTGDQVEKVKHIFKGFFSIFDTIGYLINKAATALFSFTHPAREVGRVVGAALDKIATGLLYINDKVKGSDLMSDQLLKVPDKLKDILGNIPEIGDKIKEGFERIKTSVKEAFDKHLLDPDKFLSNVDKIKSFFSKLFDGVKDIFSGLGDIFEQMISGLPNFTEAIVHLVEAFFSGLANAIQGFLNSQTLKDLMKFAESGLFLAILNNLKTFTQNIKKNGSLNLVNFVPKISAVDLSGLSSLATTLGEFKSEFLDIQALKTIGPTMLEIAAAMLIISSIDKDKVVTALGAMAALIAEMGGVVAAMIKFESSMPHISVLADNINMFESIGKAILMLSLSLLMLSTIEPAKLAGAMITISILMGLLIFISSVMEDFVLNISDIAKRYDVTSRKLTKMINGIGKMMLKFAASILVLAGALKLISTIPFDSLIDSMIALTAIMMEMVITISIISRLDMNGKVGKTMTQFAMSVLIVGASLKLLSTIPLEQMTTALFGLTVSLAAMVIALKSLAKVDYISLAIGAKALMQLSIALIPLAIALKLMSTMGYDGMAVALLSLVVGLASMAITLKALSMVVSDMKSGAIALTILSVALLGLSYALKTMSTMGFDGMAVALLSLVVGIAAMSVALSALSNLNAGKLIGVAAAFVILSAALVAIAVVFKILSGIEDVIGPLILFGTAIIALMVAFKALETINPLKLLAIAAAMAILSVSMIAMASGLAIVAAFPFMSLVGAIAALAGGLMAMALILGILSAAWAPILIGAATIAGVIAIIAAGLAILGTALMAVGKGFEVFALGITSLAMAFGVMKENTDTIKSMILPLAGMVLLFGLLSPLLVLIGAALAVVGLGIIVMGAGAVVAGAGMMVMATAMGLIAKNIEAFAQALVNAGNILMNSGEQVKVFVLTLLALSGVALITSLPLLVLGVALIALGAGLNLVGSGLTLTAIGINLFISALMNLAAFLQVVIPLVKEGFAKAWEAVKTAIHNAWEFIKNIDWEAVKEKLKEVGKWIKEKAKALWEWLKEQFPIWMEALKAKLAEWWTALKDKLHEKWEELKETIKQKWEDFKEQIGKWKDDLIEKGKNIIQGLIDGILEKWKDIKAIPGKIRDAILGGLDEEFDINSPSKETYWRGLMTGEGYNMGLEESTAETGSIIDNLGNIVNGGLDGILESGKSKVKSFFLDWTKASEETENSLSHLMNEFKDGKIPLNEFGDTIGKNWKRVKELKDELDRLTELYKTGRMSTEEYKAATANLEQEIYDLIGDVNSLKEALDQISARLQGAKAKQADLTNAYRSGRMGLHEYTEEYNRYQRVIDDCAEMQINLNGALEDTADAAGDADEKMKNYGDSVEGAGKKSKSAAQEMQDSLVKTLESQMNIFDKFEEKAAMSKEELLSNMQSQITGMTNWANNMDKLSTMGIDKGLYQKLAEMGPQGAQYVGAFANMTAEEMARANELWAQSLVLPGDIAGKISADWAGISGDMVNGLSKGWTDSEGVFHKNILDTSQEGQEVMKEDNGIHSPSTVYRLFGQALMLGLRFGMWDERALLLETLTTISEMMIKRTNELLNEETLVDTGKNLIKGLASGLRDKSALKDLEDASDHVGKIPKSVVEDVNDIDSPSKVFKQLGKYIDQGLAIGIAGNGGIVAQSMEDVSNTVLDSMKYTIATIATTLQDGIEDPVITPVLDLSRVSSGIRTLNSAFSTNQALAAAGSMSGLQNGQPVAGVQFIQNNYSPKALSRADIYRQTRNQFAQYRRVMS